MRSREIAQNKMFMIHKVLGEDAKIFSPEEEPQPSELYRRLTTYTETEQESFFSKVRKEFEEIRKKHPEVLKVVEEFPYRVKTAKRHSQENLIVLIKKGTDLFVGYKEPEGKPKIVSFEDVYEHIKASYQDRPLELSESFWKNYNELLNYTAVREIGTLRRSHAEARSMLRTILREYQLSEDLKQYLQDLLENMENYGTVPRYVINRIRNLSLNKDIQNIQKQLEELREDYPNPQVKAFTEGHEPVYILAIENRL